MTSPQELVRLAPGRPLPPYSYVPGQFPHPHSDPAGHSFGLPAHPAAELEAQAWHTNAIYLFGMDLFNRQYYWESHVEFESLWLACGRQGVMADFLKGLIKLAAAGVKHRQGEPVGVRSHACRALELWRTVQRARGAEPDLFLGLPLRQLQEQAEAICQTGWPAVSPLLLPRLPAAAAPPSE